MNIHRFWGWFLLGISGLFFATGWPTYLLADVPGFGFFRGPGRYSMVTAMAFSLLAGGVLDVILERVQLSSWKAFTLTVVLLGGLLTDLWLVAHQYQFGLGSYMGRQVFYATMVDDPPINYQDQSELREYFSKYGDNARLFARGQNVPSLLGVSSLPVYLGLGPEIYETDAVQFDFTTSDPEEIQESQQRLRKFGVTHLLLEHPMNVSNWNVTELGERYDALLNRAFARREPYYFYELNDSSGRASLLNDPKRDVQVESTPNRVSVTFTPALGSDQAEIILRDLNYPGWVPVSQSTPTNELFRQQSVTIPRGESSTTASWEYRPWSVKVGAIISILALFATLLIPILWQSKRPQPN